MTLIDALMLVLMGAFAPATATDTDDERPPVLIPVVRPDSTDRAKENEKEEPPPPPPLWKLHVTKQISNGF